MNSFEINKIVMAFLLTILVVFGISGLTEIVYEDHELESNAYPIEVKTAEAASDDADEEEQGPTLASLLAASSADKGEKVFKKCKACHTVDNGGKNLVGPNLWNVVGRAKGSVESFAYSGGMTAKGGDWSYEDLDAFLKKPKDFIDGTKMSFAGLKKPADRAAIIAYLRSLSDAPMDLPAKAAETVDAAEVDPATVD